MLKVPARPSFFRTPADWRRWLEKNHATKPELWVGFYKRDSGKPSITWPESVDGALCFGWIDGVRKSLGPESYVIRFTPRRATSIWSKVNIRRIKELMAEGLVSESGKKAFALLKKSGTYAYEQRDNAKLPPAYVKRVRANKAAWAFFSAQAPWYQKVMSWYVISAKKEETCEKRLGILIADSAAGRRVGLFNEPKKKSPAKKRV